MKQNILITFVLSLLLFLLNYPEESLLAARDGMKLWLNTMIPTLLPFLILTGILLRTDGIEKILNPLAPFWKKCFGLSPCGAYAFLLGMLCGYPMGAKLATDLYKAQKINSREASYLLTFSNNPSPVFLSTYLAQICLHGQHGINEIFKILLLSNLLCMLFFRFIIYKNNTATTTLSPSKKETSAVSSHGTVIDVSIMNGFETITRLGGYILLFSILNAAINHFWPFGTEEKYIFLGITELTTGLHQIANACIPHTRSYLYAMVMTAFGGLCVLAQTESVLEKKISLMPFFLAKCLNAALTAILVLLFAKTV